MQKPLILPGTALAILLLATLLLRMDGSANSYFIVSVITSFILSNCTIFSAVDWGVNKSTNKTINLKILKQKQGNDSH